MRLQCAESAFGLLLRFGSLIPLQAVLHDDQPAFPDARYDLLSEVNFQSDTSPIRAIYAPHLTQIRDIRWSSRYINSSAPNRQLARGLFQGLRGLRVVPGNAHLASKL